MGGGFTAFLPPVADPRVAGGGVAVKHGAGLGGTRRAGTVIRNLRLSMSHQLANTVTNTVPWAEAANPPPHPTPWGACELHIRMTVAIWYPCRPVNGRLLEASPTLKITKHQETGAPGRNRQEAIGQRPPLCCLCPHPTPPRGGAW